MPASAGIQEGRMLDSGVRLPAAGMAGMTEEKNVMSCQRMLHPVIGVLDSGFRLPAAGMAGMTIRSEVHVSRVTEYRYLNVMPANAGIQ